MSTWRAKKYSVTINRRHRVTCTVRRFRLVKKSARQHQLIVSIPLRHIRQIRIEYKRLGRRKPAITVRQRFTQVTATLFVIAGLSGITYNVAALGKPTSIEPVKIYQTPAASAPVVKPMSLPKSTPTHISIASQKIDTGLIPVGLDENGAIDPPPVLEWIAGWYQYSPTPGEIGPAVIVGHVDSYEDISVFWRLRDVQAGDTIDVSREDGTTATFAVTQLAQYDQNNFPTETVYGNTSGAELRVITCGGSFDVSTGHYTQNTVVYAKLVSSRK